MDNNELNGQQNDNSVSPELQSMISSAIENKKSADSSDIKRQVENGADSAPDVKFKPNGPKLKPRTPKQSANQNRPQVQNAPKQSAEQKTEQNRKPQQKKSRQSGKPQSQNSQNIRSDTAKRNNRAAAQNNIRQNVQQNEASAKQDKNQSDKQKNAAVEAAEVSAEQSQTKKGWSIKKKTGVTLGIIFLVFVLLVGIIVGLFFHYTGLLNRNTDTTINSGAAPLNSSDWVDKDDTFDQAAKEAELRAELEKNSTKISSEDVTNILLIGEDIRDTASDERGNTDVMMIISLNTKQKTITMTSLMRDMYIYMSQFGDSGRLNAAYWHGGAPYLEEVIEDYYGIEIDRYVKVNFRQFIDVVETVGGLDLTVAGNEAYAMDAPLAEQNKYLKYQKGTDYLDKSLFPTDDTKVDLHLNGNQSLAYARIRYNCGDDYGRTQRQRIVIQEVIKKAKSLSFFELDKLMNKVFPEVETDITDGEIASLLLGAFDYMNYDIQELRIPADGYYTDEVINNMQVLNFNVQANAAIIEKVIYGEAKNVEEAVAEYEQEIADGTFYANNQTDGYGGYNQNYGY